MSNEGDLKNASPLTWVQGMVNENGHALEFKRHRFLIAPYNDLHPDQVIMKSAQVGWCLDPETKILTADLRWIPIRKAQVGMKLMAVDESPVGLMHGRRLRVAEVEAKRYLKEEAFRLTMDDGRILIATANHRFLTHKRGGVDTLWRPVEKIQVGDRIRHAVRPWGEPGYEDGWMGGFIDGEGSLDRHSGIRAQVIQREGETLDRAERYLSENGLRVNKTLRNRGRGGLGSKPVYDLTVSRSDEVLYLLGKTRPTRFIGRTDWWEGVCLSNAKGGIWPAVVKVESVGVRRMVDLQTSTKTFIAEGFVSHNSTLAILKSFYLARYGSLNVIYTLPTQNVVKDFVFPKVNPLIEKNGEVADLVSKDAVQLKQVGDRFIYYRGSYSEKEAIAISADLLINDELDRSDQRILTTYESRLQASEYGWKWRFSNPTVPGFGVHELYQKSDQHQWFVRCACSHEAWLSFEPDPTNRAHYLDHEAELYRCGACGAVLEDKDRMLGRWVALKPGAPRRGYHVSQLIAPWVSPARVMEQYRESGPEFFHNFVLGLPYLTAELVVDRETILAATTPSDLPTLTDVCIGVDNGVVKHYVIGTPAGIFTYGKTESWEEIERLIRTFNAYCVIDANPYPNIPKQLVKKYRGKVFINYYNLNDTKKLEMVKWDERANYGIIRTDRTKIIDFVASELHNQEIKFLMHPERMEEYINHWGHMYRAIQTNTQGIARGVWLTKENRADHYAHATVYFRLALDRTKRGLTGGVRPGGPDRRQGVVINPVTKTLDPMVSIESMLRGQRR